MQVLTVKLLQRYLSVYACGDHVGFSVLLLAGNKHEQHYLNIKLIKGIGHALISVR